MRPFQWHLWRNRLAQLAVNQKVGGSSPPRCGDFFIPVLFVDDIFHLLCRVTQKNCMYVSIKMHLLLVNIVNIVTLGL